MKDSNSFFVILGVLTRGNESGYDIKKTIENVIGHYYKVSNGQIYPTLKKLVERGLATCTLERNDDKPNRKIYEITEKGRLEFDKWLHTPVDFRNPSGNEYLLRLFFGPAANEQYTIGLVNELIQITEKQLDDYHKIEHTYYSQKPDSPIQLYEYITLLHGIALTQASIDWAIEAKALIQYGEFGHNQRPDRSEKCRPS